MEQQDWQDIWQDLEIAHGLICEHKGKGEDDGIDGILRFLRASQSIAGAHGAVPAESGDSYGRCHCAD